MAVTPSSMMTGAEMVALCRRHTIFEWSAQAAVNPIPMAKATTKCCQAITASGVSGARERRRAATPEVIGVANDVPLPVVYWFGLPPVFSKSAAVNVSPARSFWRAANRTR